MEFLQTSPALTKAEIQEAEGKMSLVLPQELVDHYFKYNGGYPENDVFVWPDGSQTRINAFAAIKYPGFINVEEIYIDLVVIEQYLPKEIVPFASDDGGNFFCISAREKDNGYIYYCNNDRYNTENREECLTQIEQSFKKFIEGLKKP